MSLARFFALTKSVKQCLDIKHAGTWQCVDVARNTHHTQPPGKCHSGKIKGVGGRALRKRGEIKKLEKNSPA